MEKIKNLLKNKKIVALVIIGLLLMVTSVTYAFYLFGISQEGENQIASDCFKLTFTDKDDISLENTLPISDSDAESLKPYEFTLKNICKTAVDYSVNIETIVPTTLSVHYVKIKVDNDPSYKLSTIDTNTTKVIDDAIESRTIKTGSLLGNESVTYKLKMWVDEETTVDQGANKVLSAKITISGVMNKNNRAITLHLNGGTSNVNRLLVKNNTKIGTLPEATKDNYILNGWYSDEELTNLVTSDTIVTPDLTDLYAKWETEKVGNPILFQGLTPIKFEDKNSDGVKDIVIADISEEWYNYDNHEWANAAILDNSKTYTVGQVVDEADVLQMYVWIPRYRYQLWNAENGSSNEQMINIEFESKSTPKSNGSSNGEWLTHPAFTFGNTEIEGFWVGKFEPSYYKDGNYQQASLECTDTNCANSQYLRIKPSVTSLHSDAFHNMYYGARSIENMNVFGLDSSKVDSHMMKNMEWGAVAYLSASKYGLYTSDGSTCHNSANVSGTGCQIWINQSYDYKTGVSGPTMDSYPMPSQFLWNDATYGGNSSTTGNMYGIYDMNGGSWEYVMGNVISSETYEYNPGDIYTYQLSEMPNIRYIDTYTNPEGTYQGNAHKNGKLGDATKETLKTFGSTSGGWYSDSTNFPYGQINTYGNSPWFLRGGQFSTTSSSGIFSFGYQTYTGLMTFRPVITAEDNQ